MAAPQIMCALQDTVVIKFWFSSGIWKDFEYIYKFLYKTS
jgi:hypothetical protein